MSTVEEATQAPKEDVHKIFVGNLDSTTTKETLETFFSPCGKVLEAVVKYRKPQGFGFVAFATLAEAEKATSQFDKKELDGQEITVELAKQREPEFADKKKKKKSPRKPRAAKTEKKETETEGTPVETEETKPKTSVYVSKLDPEFTVENLNELFKNFEVKSSFLANTKYGRSKCYGIVELTTVEEMEKVLRECADLEVEGKPILVELAKSEKNTERKVRKRSSSKKSTTAANNGSDDAAVATAEATATDGQPKKTKSRKRKSAKRSNKAKEGVEAAEGAAEAVDQFKKDVSIDAAHKAQDAVKELKAESVISATHVAKAKKEGEVVNID